MKLQIEVPTDVMEALAKAQNETPKDAAERLVLQGLILFAYGLKTGMEEGHEHTMKALNNGFDRMASRLEEMADKAKAVVKETTREHTGATEA